MSNLVEFEWYRGDRLCSYVLINRSTGTVEVRDFTGNVIEQFLGMRPRTIESVYNVFESRCFDRARPDADELLHGIGLTQYDPFGICLVTEGRKWGDDYWIKWIQK